MAPDKITYATLGFLALGVFCATIGANGQLFGGNWGVEVPSLSRPGTSYRIEGGNRGQSGSSNSNNGILQSIISSQQALHQQLRAMRERLAKLVGLGGNGKRPSAQQTSDNSSQEEEKEKKFDYEQQGADWPKKFPTCKGDRQSPIDISTQNIKLSPGLKLNLLEYDRDINSATIVNNGHTVQLNPKESVKPAVEGSAVNDARYEFAQFHFHWGSTDNKGSEHTINGLHLPIEMHLVHQNTKYGSFDEAAKQPEGLMVLVVLFQVNNQTNPNLDGLIDAVSSVREKGSEAPLRSPINLARILPANRQEFFRYPGSLTTPECNESVLFVILANPQQIGSRQLEAFRQTRSAEGGPLVDNYRVTQPLNSRTVEFTG